eukprot:scaffold14996_cov63-Phaeocystis_antarctica.AAC.3
MSHVWLHLQVSLQANQECVKTTPVPPGPEGSVELYKHAHGPVYAHSPCRCPHCRPHRVTGGQRHQRYGRYRGRCGERLGKEVLGRRHSIGLEAAARHPSE